MAVAAATTMGEEMELEEGFGSASEEAGGGGAASSGARQNVLFFCLFLLLFFLSSAALRRGGLLRPVSRSVGRIMVMFKGPTAVV